MTVEKWRGTKWRDFLPMNYKHITEVNLTLFLIQNPKPYMLLNLFIFISSLHLNSHKAKRFLQLPNLPTTSLPTQKTPPPAKRFLQLLSDGHSLISAA